MKLAEVYKLTVFVPPDSVQAVLEGILKITPLRHGRYEQVAWWSTGVTEQYLPLHDSNPTSGEPGKLSRGVSVRMEIEIPRDQDLLRRVLEEGVLPCHPWEEPAIFIQQSLTVMSSSN